MRQDMVRAIRVVLLAAVLAGSNAGCPGSSGGGCIVGTESCACTSVGVCDTGLSCLAGFCVDPARNGLAPRDGGVSPPTTPILPRQGSIGSSCAQPTDCAEGLCLSSETLPGGYCSKSCGAQVISLGDGCPDDAACTQINEATSLCLALCGTLAPCRAGYVCAPSGGRSVCQPRCENDRACRPGYGCNTSTGLCEKGARALGRSGAPCLDSGQCASNACVTEAASNGNFPGGYCVRPCTAAEEDRPCAGNDGICVGLPKDDGTKTFACLGSCSTGVDCRPEYHCSADAGNRTPDGIGACVPRCDRVGCRTGFTCDTSLGACVEGGGGIIGTGQIDRLALGTLRVGRTTPDFKTISIQVPAGAVSFSIVGQLQNMESIVVPVRVTTPSGQVVLDMFDPAKTAFRSPVPIYPGQPFTLVYPNSPRLNLVPGTYQVVIGASDTTDVQLTVLLKKQMGVLQGGKLPVGLWFSKQKHLSAQTARTDSRFQAALATMVQIYASVGIELGPFSYVDLTGSSAESLAVIEDQEQLGELFAHADASMDQALNFFFIDQFNLEGGAGVIGASGGIPGPPGLPGLPHGGVAVALALLLPRSELLAETMAHEGGHYLGLFHTSERTGLTFDPLLDTAECPASANTDGDMIVDNRECAGQGSDNLMFWTTSGQQQQRKLTNDQRFVLLRNPVLQ
jgi:hypothetical protein